MGLIGLKVGGLNGTSSISLSAVEAALCDRVYDDQAKYNIRVVNMSLGAGFFTSEGQATSDILFDDVRRLEQIGVTVVSAAGNSYDQFQEPGSSSPGIFSTLDVGAVLGENEGGPIPRRTGDTVEGQYDRGRPDHVLQLPAQHGQRDLRRDDDPQHGARRGLPRGGGREPGVAPDGGREDVAMMQQAAFEFGGRYLTPDEVKTILINNADTINDGDDEDTTVRTTGLNFPRLNAYRAVLAVPALFGNPDPVSLSRSRRHRRGTTRLAGRSPGRRWTGRRWRACRDTGTDGSLNVGGADVDMISFTTAVAGRVTMATYPVSGTIDTMLRVFDSAGNELAFNDDKGGGDRASVPIGGPAGGTFYAGVSGFNNRNYDPNRAGSGAAGATGEYVLQMRLDSPDPNGVLSGAVALNVTQEPQLTAGSIGYDNASMTTTGT